MPPLPPWGTTSSAPPWGTTTYHFDASHAALPRPGSAVPTIHAAWASVVQHQFRLALRDAVQARLEGRAVKGRGGTVIWVLEERRRRGWTSPNVHPCSSSLVRDKSLIRFCIYIYVPYTSKEWLSGSPC